MRKPRSGVIAVTHVLSGLRLLRHRARRCAWAYAVPFRLLAAVSSGRAFGARYDEIHIVLRHPERRNVETVSVQPPECITSASIGTAQSSGSVSQPSGRATEAGEPCRPRGPAAAGGNGTSGSS